MASQNIADLGAVVNLAVKGLGSFAAARAEFKSLAHAGFNLEKAFRAQAWATAFTAYGLQNLVRVFGSITGAYARFEDAVARAAVVLGKDQVVAIERVRNAALLMRGVEHAPVQLALAMGELGRAGIVGSQALNDIKVAADLATVAHIPLEDAAIKVANAFKAWGNPLTTSEEILDKFTRTAHLSTFNLGNLVKAMEQAQGPARAMGQSLTTTLAGLAILAPVTGANTKAGSSFGAALQFMGDKKLQALMHQMKIPLTQGGERRDVLDIYADFYGKARKQGMLKEMELLRQVAKRRGIALPVAVDRLMTEGTMLGGVHYTGRAAIDAMRKRIEIGMPGSSLANKAELLRKESPAVQWTAFQSDMQRIQVGFGQELVKVLLELKPAIMGLAHALQFLLSGTSGTVIGIMAIAGTVVGVGKLLKGLVVTMGGGQLLGALGLSAGGPLLSRLNPATMGLVERAFARSRMTGGGAGGGGGAGYQAVMMHALSGAPLIRPLGFWGSMRPNSEAYHRRMGRYARSNLLYGRPLPGLGDRYGWWKKDMGAMVGGAYNTTKGFLGRAPLVGGVLGPVGGGLAGGAALVGGLLGTVASTLGPFALLTGAVIGLTYWMGKAQEKTEAQAKAGEKTKVDLEGLPALAARIKAAIEGRGSPIVPGWVQREFTQNPNLYGAASAIFGAAGTMSAKGMPTGMALKKAGLAWVGAHQDIIREELYNERISPKEAKERQASLLENYTKFNKILGTLTPEQLGAVFSLGQIQGVTKGKYLSPKDDDISLRTMHIDPARVVDKIRQMDEDAAKGKRPQDRLFNPEQRKMYEDAMADRFSTLVSTNVEGLSGLKLAADALAEKFRNMAGDNDPPLSWLR